MKNIIKVIKRLLSTKQYYEFNPYAASLETSEKALFRTKYNYDFDNLMLNIETRLGELIKEFTISPDKAKTIVKSLSNNNDALAKVIKRLKSEQQDNKTLRPITAESRTVN